jgi:hypothetical protein
MGTLILIGILAIHHTILTRLDRNWSNQFHDMNGFTACARLHAKHQLVPVQSLWAYPQIIDHPIRGIINFMNLLPIPQIDPLPMCRKVMRGEGPKPKKLKTPLSKVIFPNP